MQYIYTMVFYSASNQTKIIKFTAYKSRKYYTEWGDPGPERQYHMVSLLSK